MGDGAQETVPKRWYIGDRCTGDGAQVTDLLKAGAQVAAEDEADAVDLHAVNAGLHVPFTHSLQVVFLLHRGPQITFVTVLPHSSQAKHPQINPEYITRLAIKNTIETKISLHTTMSLQKLFILMKP